MGTYIYIYTYILTSDNYYIKHCHFPKKQQSYASLHTGVLVGEWQRGPDLQRIVIADI